MDAQDVHLLEKGEYEVASVIPWDIGACRFDPKRRYVRYRVPAKMRPDRVVEDYREVVVEEEAGIIAVHTDKACRVADATILFF